MSMLHIRHPAGHVIAVSRNWRSNAKVRRHNRRLLERQGLPTTGVVDIREWAHVSEWWDGWEDDAKLLGATT